MRGPAARTEEPMVSRARRDKPRRVMMILSDSLGLVGDAVKLLTSADEETAIGDRRGRQYLAAHVVVGEDLQLRTVFENDHEAVLADDEDLAIGRHRRGVVVAEVAEAFL